MMPVTAAAALVSGGKPPPKWARVRESPPLPGLRVGREAGAKRGPVHHLGEPAGALSSSEVSP